MTIPNDHRLVARLLVEHGRAAHVETTVMSVEVDSRKPHRRNVRTAVEPLEVKPSGLTPAGVWMTDVAAAPQAPKFD